MIFCSVCIIFRYQADHLRRRLLLTTLTLLRAMAAPATIGLISFYSASVLRIRRLVVQLTSLLAIIYGFIFVVLQLEDYALLAGSIGIFIALASVMYYSRKVDWDNLQA